MNIAGLPPYQVQIRPASFNDLPYIQEIAYKTWPNAYGEILSPDQLTYMLDKIYSISSLTDQLKRGHQFYLAAIHNEAIGFASFSHEQEFTYKLQKLYVLPGHQKTGAGRKLLNTVEYVVKSLGGETLLLNVNRHNVAKTFYEKYGFKVIREEDIDIGSGYFMNDYVMEKGLTLSPSPEGEGGPASCNDDLQR